MSNEFIVAAIESLFIPVAINSNTDAGTSHDVEIIGLFNESTWDYPVARYIDPDDNSDLAPRLYSSFDLDAHIERMKTSTTVFYGECPEFLKKPYIISVEPKELHITISQTQNLTFFINAFDTDVSYRWYINDQQQSSSSSEFSSSFTANTYYTVKAVVSNTSNDSKTIIWTINEQSGINISNKLNNAYYEIRMLKRGNHSLQILFHLPYSGNVSIIMHDIKGRILSMVPYGRLLKGENIVHYDIKPYAEKILFCSIMVDGKRVYTKKWF